MSASVLIGGWCSDSAEVHTWYGAVTTSSLWLGVVYIQAGMSSSGFMDKVRYTLTLGTSCTTVQGHIAVLLPSLIPWKGQRSTCKESPTQWISIGSICCRQHSGRELSTGLAETLQHCGQCAFWASCWASHTSALLLCWPAANARWCHQCCPRHL